MSREKQEKERVKKIKKKRNFSIFQFILLFVFWVGGAHVLFVEFVFYFQVLIGFNHL